MIAAVRARVTRRRDDAKGDEGMTLVELIVAMGIFSVVLVVFMAAVSTMAQTTVKSQASSDASSQLRTVFQRFDKELRYASDINTPGTAGGSIYVEYWVPQNAGTGESQCVQWRYVKSTNELQRRTWEQGDPASVTSWRTMVTGLRNNLSLTAQQPFTVHRAGTIGSKVYLHQSLDIFLDAGMGTSGDTRGSQLAVSFVAQNSSTASLTNPGVTKVCLTGSVQRP
ncbi:PulJ/GspJ family protein [Demequina sp.]|uniref:PulJ/GspJ family protein n=1 Tax=Demequina sp. TaxID=2050685 RepID=UPI003D11ECD2